MDDQVYTGKAHVPKVIDHVEKDDNSRIALQGVKPVARHGIVNDVVFPAPPDVNPVKRVKGQGNENAEDFQTKTEGKL